MHETLLAEFRFPLRRDFTVAAFIPGDITKQEAERLCAAIRLLVIPPEAEDPSKEKTG